MHQNMPSSRCLVTMQQHSVTVCRSEFAVLLYTLVCARHSLLQKHTCSSTHTCQDKQQYMYISVYHYAAVQRCDTDCTGKHCHHFLRVASSLQAARQNAEQRSQELSSQVDRLAEQAVESAAEAQRSMTTAEQKAAKDREHMEVLPYCLALLHHHNVWRLLVLA